MKDIKGFMPFLGQCIRQDKEAWNDFTERYGTKIYNYIRHTLNKYDYVWQEDDINEILHNVFLTLIDDDCRRLSNFRGNNERSFLAYLRTISFHVAVDYLMEWDSFIDFDAVQDVLPARNRSRQLEWKEMRSLVSMLRNDLPARHNRMFGLLYEEDLNQTEIAHIMDLQPNAVHQLKYRMIRNFIRIAKNKEGIPRAEDVPCLFYRQRR